MPFLLDRAALIVSDRLPAVLSVAALAAALGVDRSTLYRAAQRAGTTPSALIRDVRLGQAAALLERAVAVGAAGAAVGYHEAAAFSRAFRRRYGVPPSRWAPSQNPPPAAP